MSPRQPADAIIRCGDEPCPNAGAGGPVGRLQFLSLVAEAEPRNAVHPITRDGRNRISVPLLVRRSEALATLFARRLFIDLVFPRLAAAFTACLLYTSDAADE